MRRTLLIACLFAGCKLSCFAPKAEQIEAPIADDLTAAEPSTANKFDHSALHELLKKHARPDSGRVDYQGLAQEKEALQSYADTLADVDLATLDRGGRKALLINAYNAFTLLLILENYPGLASIKDLTQPWKTKRWKLAADTVSLDDIEHGLLRPTFKDPRIHFGVNCASIGCPPLADFAFTGAKVDKQLEAVTKRTLTTPRYARVEGETLQLTALLNWYGDDFVTAGWEPRADSLTSFVGRYLPAAADATAVNFVDYDWSLNDVVH